MLKKVIVPSVLALVVALVGTIYQSNGVEAWPSAPPCELEGYHYARQWTAGIEPTYYREEEMGCATVVSPAFVAHGVGGSLQAPTSYPVDFNPYIDHVFGSFSLVWDETYRTWIEFGIYTGTIGHGTEIIQRLEEEIDPGDLTGWGFFVEVYGPDEDDYEVVDLGDAVPGESYYSRAWEWWKPVLDGTYVVSFWTPGETITHVVDDFPSIYGEDDHALVIVGLEIFDYDCAASEDCDTVPQTTSFLFGEEYSVFVQAHDGTLEPMAEYMTHSQVSHYDEENGDGSPAEPLIGQHFLGEDMASFAAHSHLACPAKPWTVPDGDSDCDGFRDSLEGAIGTDPNSICSSATDAWPPDFDENLYINVFDILSFSPYMHPNYDLRHDLDYNRAINVFDILRLSPFMGYPCTS